MVAKAVSSFTRTTTTPGGGRGLGNVSQGQVWLIPYHLNTAGNKIMSGGLRSDERKQKPRPKKVKTNKFTETYKQTSTKTD